MCVQELEETDWFQSLVREVGHELKRLDGNQPDRRAALHHEYGQLQAQIDGWAVSLAKTDLDTALRAEIETHWANALGRRREIEIILAEQESKQDILQELLDPGQVASRLERLSDILAANNPTQGNLELAQHIDRIDCFSDGTVNMRTCKLSFLSGAAELFVEDNPQVPELGAAATSPTKQATPRRRARLRIEGPIEQSEESKRSPTWLPTLIASPGWASSGFGTTRFVFRVESCRGLKKTPS